MDASSSKSGRSISGREWRFVAAVAMVVLVLTSLPYVYGYVASPPDKHFMGLMLDVPDHGQYLSWWREFQTAVLIPNKLTPEPNEPVFFNLLWWVLAQVSRWTGLGYAPVYQVLRWVAGGSFLWAVYRLIARLVPADGGRMGDGGARGKAGADGGHPVVRRRRMAFLLVASSSGFGWVLVVLKYVAGAWTGGELLFPLDVYVAEGNTFLCILGYPHFALAMTFIALTFEFGLRGWKEQKTRYFVVAGVLALILGWQHAYDLLIIYGIMGVFALLVWWRGRAFPWRLFWGEVIVCALSCSGAIYSVILTTVDPLWEEVLAQFANGYVYTPSPPHLVILFGLPLLLALAAWIGLAWSGGAARNLCHSERSKGVEESLEAGHRQGRSQWSEEDLFVMGWFLGGALLNYVPTDFQIHMLNSWQIPMMLLATKGLYDFIAPAIVKWGSGLGERVVRWVAVAFVVAVLPTNVYLWVWRFLDLARGGYPYYLSTDEVAALEWLDENTEPEDVVLSSLTIGQYIPALSGNTAFLAHWAQTVGFYDKRERVARFFDADVPDDERVETLESFGVDYVLRGPAECALGDYDPENGPWLTLVFSRPQVEVYRVEEDAFGQADQKHPSGGTQ